MNLSKRALLLLCASCLLACDDTHRQHREELAREAADYVADVARKDPERAGKVGVARALHVRALALGRARAFSHRARFDALSPTCRPHLIPQDHLELLDVHLEVRGTRQFSWQQRIETRRHDDITHMVIDARYTDDETILPGERYTEIFWADNMRWSRSARSPEAMFIKDPYPERSWRTFSAAERSGMESLIALVDAWRRDEQGHYGLAADQQGVSLGCEFDEAHADHSALLDELEDVLARQRGSMQRATLVPEQLEGISGWRIHLTWRLGERGVLEATLFRGRRSMTQDELSAWSMPEVAMEAIAGQGERVKNMDSKEQE